MIGSAKKALTARCARVVYTAHGLVMRRVSRSANNAVRSCVPTGIAPVLTVIPATENSVFGVTLLQDAGRLTILKV